MASIVITSHATGKDKLFVEGVREYTGRIKRYARLDLVDQAPLKRGGYPLPEGDTVVALDAGGRCYDSAGFADRLESWLQRGHGRVNFVIGDAYGLDGQTRGAAHSLLSLSSMTLPHRLVRLVLLEQVYRALTIRAGHPYDH